MSEKVYFEWSSNVHGAMCNNCFVLLHIFKDDYTALNEEASSYLHNILMGVFVKKDSHFLNMEETIVSRIQCVERYLKIFLKEGIIIETNNKVRNNKIAFAKKPGGLFMKEWFIQNNCTEIPNLLLIFLAFYYLSKTHLIMKYRKLYGLINYLEKLSKKPKKLITAYNKSCLYARAMNIACMFFPKKTMCLPFASALAAMHYKKEYNCEFVIGVQNLPFYAHAWLQVDGKVINDSDELQQKLAPIYALIPKNA